LLLLKLFWTFFLIGCFSFGGGYAMLPLIEKQVTDLKWMTTDQFTNIIGISGMLPGSIGTNAAVFIGFQKAGVLGALVSTLGMVLPSLLIILFIEKILIRFSNSQFVLHAFYGLRPVITGLIFYSAIKFALSMEVITAISWESVSMLMIFLLSLFLLFTQKVNPIVIIFLSGVCGALLFH
jgi:chromate transporter